MKKIFTLSALLSLATFVFAQDANKIGMSEPEFITEFTQNEVSALGVNSDGRFVYGMNGSGSAFIYDFNSFEPFKMLEATPSDYFGITVAGFSPEGLALVSHYTNSYFYNTETGDKEYIESPDSNFGLDAWDISADGKYIGCNLTTEDFIVIPMIAEKKEDGTYKYTYLDYDKNDAMGCPAQYTQVRFISDDAKYLIGIQPDNRGMGGRLVVWEKQEDGTYKFTTPLDEYLYDLSAEKPGIAPEWDDYVTADYETETELFNQQAAEYDKVFEEYETKYMKFTRNQSALEIYMMNKATRSNTVCMAFYDNRVNNESDMIPVFFDCDTKEIKEYPEMIGCFGMEQLPGGGHIVAKDQTGFYSLTAIDNDGNTQPFHEWLTDKTGTDISKDFSFTFYDVMNDVEISGIFLGLPYFSEDGKNLVLTGADPEVGSITSILRFDNDIFATTTDINNIGIEENITIANGKISLGNKQGIAEIYSLNGAKCGSYTVNGSFNFNEVLSSGTYVVKMNVENMKPISFKIIVK